MTRGSKKKRNRRKGKQGSSSSSPPIQDAAPPQASSDMLLMMPAGSNPPTRDPRRPPDTQEASSSPASSARIPSIPQAGSNPPTRDSRRPPDTQEASSSPASSARIPSIPQGATPPSAGTTRATPSPTRSFAAVAMAGRTLPAPRVVAPKLIDAVDDDVLAAQFLLFLKGYVEPGEEFGFYRAQVHSMRKQGRYKLKVDFDHLLRCLRDDRNYIKLVFRIGNDTDSKHQWLRLVVRQFLKDEEFGGEEEKIDNNAEVSFVNRPISIRMLKDFLEDQVPLIKDITVLAGRFTVRATTARGRQAFRSVLAELLLLKHKHDVFYDGDFGIEDLVIINSTRCLILKKPQSLPSMSTLGGHTSTAKAKVNDLKKLWTIMEKYYIRGGVFPLYFEELSDDLTSASEADIREAWFADYLLAHPALMPSMSRKHLVYELHSAVRVFKLGRDPEFKAILSARPICDDWRSKVLESGDDILLGVYWYKFGDVNETNEEPHENTTEGILRYKRHLLQHTIDHIDKAKNAKAKDRGKGKKEGKDKEKDDDLNDLDEIELFAAATVPSFLPNLLKRLLQQCQMRGKLMGAWSNYYSTMSDMKDLPSK